MDLSDLFYGWTKQRAFWFIGLALVTLLSIFVSLNVGIGKPEEIKGKVTAVGLETTSRYELPAPLVTIRLRNGNVVTVEAERNIVVNINDEVVILKSEKMLTSGSKYKLQKVLK